MCLYTTLAGLDFGGYLEYSLYICLWLGQGVLRCALGSPFGLMVPGIVASSSLSSVWSRLTQRYTAGESRKLRLNGVKASFLDDTSGIPLSKPLPTIPHGQIIMVVKGKHIRSWFISIQTFVENILIHSVNAARRRNSGNAVTESDSGAPGRYSCFNQPADGGPEL